MRGHDFPHQSHPLEEDIRDIEDSEEPLVLGVGLVDGAVALAQARRLRIPDIGTVQEGHEICAENEQLREMVRWDENLHSAITRGMRFQSSLRKTRRWIAGSMWTYW